MHAHASDTKLTEAGSAKFFVKSNGSSILKNRGALSDKELKTVQTFIKENYREMYLKWSVMSQNGFFGNNAQRM